MPKKIKEETEKKVKKNKLVKAIEMKILKL